MAGVGGAGHCGADGRVRPVRRCPGLGHGGTKEIKKPDDIQGIRFTKDGQTFKASQISREFSFARLNAQLSWKPSETQQESEHKVQQRIPNGGHLFESTGPGLFSPTNGTAPEELLSQEELLRKRKKKKKRKGFGL